MPLPFGYDLKQLFTSGLIESIVAYLHVLAPVLAVISLYISVVWLQLQSRFYFLTISIATFVLLGYEVIHAIFLQPETDTQIYPFLHLSLHMVFLTLLAIAPSIPEKIAPDLSTLLKKNFWLLILCILVPGTAFYLDMIHFQLPTVVEPKYIWTGLFTAIFIILIYRLVKNNKSNVFDAITYLFIFLIFSLASWLDRFQNANYAIGAVVPANVLLIYLLLRNHRHSVALEAELRSGLLEQNQNLRNENQIHTHILKFSREAILRLDRDEYITYCNNAFEELTGLKLPDIQQQKLAHVLSRNFYDAAQQALKSARRSKSGLFEIKIRKPEGEENAFTVYAEPLLDARQKFNGTHLGFVDISAPIAQRDTLDSRLSQQGYDLELFRTALTMTEEALVLTDKEEHIVLINAAFTRLTGYAADDLLGQSTKFYRMRNSHGEAIGQTLQQGKNWQGQLNNKRKDGSRLETDVVATPVLDDKGALQYILWTERDAAERKNRKKEKDDLLARIKGHAEAYQNLEKQLDALFSVSENGILLLRPEGTCAFMNSVAEHQLGYVKDELPTKKLPGFVKDLLRLEANYGDKMEVRLSDYHDDFVRPDGKKVTFRWRGTPVWSTNKEPLGVVLHIFEPKQEIDKSAERRITDNTHPDHRETLEGLNNSIYNELLNLSEMLNSSGDSASLAIGLRNAAHSIHWPRYIFYEKNTRSNSYEAMYSGGFSPGTVRQLNSLPCDSVDQYLHSRFAIGNAFFLSQNKLEEGQKNWAFSPAKLTFEDQRSWQPKDTVLFPLQAKGRHIGLLLLGEPSSGALPAEKTLLSAEKFAQQLAFFLHRKLENEIEQIHYERTALLLELSRLETANELSVHFLEKLIKKIRHILHAEVCIFADAEKQFGACSRKSSRGTATTTPFPNATDLLQKIRVSGKAGETDTEQKRIHFFTNKMGLQSSGRVFTIEQKMLCKRRDYGVILCGRENEAFSEEEQAYLEEVAAQMGRLIESSLLFSEIESKASELEKSNVLISEFLANVSHELRTPLHAILSYVELLRQKGKAPEKERLRHLETIRHSGKKLLNLINDLLDLSKIEAGKIEPKPSVFSPREMMQNIEREMLPLCAESGLELRLTIDKNVPTYIRTDLDMLERVTLNLARNAQKYTDAGHVAIKMKMTAKNYLYLAVQDTGIGIAKDAQKTIFEPFQQLQSSGQIRHKGSGLGLAISNSIIELLKGSIKVESEPGKGTVFTFEIPVEPMQRKPKGAPAEKQKPASKKKVHKKNSLILLVDDDDSTREAMRFLLENAGYQVEFAGDGEKAITLAQRLRPDLILLDVMMPGMDGLQTTRVLKSQKQLQDIPVIALTARAMQEDREKALAAGCDDFLSKPFEMDVFLDLVGKYI
ncbi:MAG: PAS domain S-box protein [Deferribacteres bacterium]|nr:PAS domain S-box protein [candidate division KSB1 bacterium]MCB9500387.1 PAS domain S-box protein [Deferribacteres bacterium]